MLFIFLSLVLLFLSTDLLINFLGRGDHFEKPDLIVVLGCGSQVEKPLLNDRLEAAIRAHAEYPNIPILLTGDEKNKSEITSMSEYINRRIPNAKIVLDSNSLNTWDSFVYIKNNFPTLNSLVITNEFHQKRSLFLARLLSLKAKSNSKDHLYRISYQMFIRERLARIIANRYFFHKN